MKISVVVPVYNEAGNVPEFIRRIVPILKSRTADFEIIFTLDPSKDNTEEIILAEHKSDARIKLLKFSRRVGQPMATLAGLHYSTGDVVIVIDVDLQDPPELVLQMLDKWAEGYDVVYAQRSSRKGETWVKEVVSNFGYGLINKMADVPIPVNTGDFRLMSRRVVDQINALKESHGFLRGMVALVGFKQTAVIFDRPARFAGQGNYNRFLGSLRIGLNGLFCFSTQPLALSFKGAAFLFVLAAVALVISFNQEDGVPAICSALFFVGGLLLIGLGILGEYVGRIYEEVKERPKFIVDSQVGFEKAATRGPS